ncbi:MAG: PQQ-dependent sugar dehydrogenase [Bryobacteraceae bacterium]|nr:PQQ-dependent sugar dehydrogenase [Bryobacteraceae bacterium]
MRFWAATLFFASICWGQTAGVRLTTIATGITNPTDIQAPRDGSRRVFFAQQNGIVRIFRDGTLLAQPFLDIRAKIHPEGRPESERGLLGLAFPANFRDVQYFYASYTNLSGNSVLSRFRVSAADPNQADVSSEQILLTQNQPFSNHNGGQIQFGPDGFLYFGLGDGGSANDPLRAGQDRRTWLGKMLRLAVEPNLGRAEAAPGNPFRNDSTYLPEIWALGLRNPWRFSFDRTTGDLWIADVGQNRAEEVNVQAAASRGGENYGWVAMEGMECFSATAPNNIGTCDKAPFTLPVLEYGRSEGCSVSGGYVYRGSNAPGLRGTYLYADFCTRRIWGLRREGDRWVNQLLATAPQGAQITTFGEDEAGEIYVGDFGRDLIAILSGNASPEFTAAGMTNAATYRTSGLTPGSLATLFVSGAVDVPGIVAATGFPLPQSLSNVSITVGGRTAPLHSIAYVNGIEQINFQAPYELAGQSQATVVVRRGTTASAEITVPVVAASPGVYAREGRGVVVFNRDNTLVTPERRAAAGDDLYFYAAGLGAVSNTPPTGAATPLSPLSRTAERPVVTLGGVPCEVEFSGLAPTFAGVYQVNIRAPQGVPAGDADLVLSIGGMAAPPVKVAVR